MLAVLNLFYSFSHKDSELVASLETHLALLKRKNFIQTWHHRCVVPGEDWKAKVDENIKTADIIVLLVSADFLDSDYCYEVELKTAMARHERGEAIVVPVLLRPVEWQGAAFCKLQPLPRNGKPVSRWESLDEAWSDVVKGIQEAADKLIARRQSLLLSQSIANVASENNGLLISGLAKLDNITKSNRKIVLIFATLSIVNLAIALIILINVAVFHSSWQSIHKADPLIVLQTDFGSKAPYMGSLIGSIYKYNPRARVQVITSEIEGMDVLHAAWTLWRASRSYPAGTIFVVITNPGGLTSKPAVIITKNGHIYIGHDNGTFDFVVENYGYKESYIIASPLLTPVENNDQFGGSDLFGPTAAKISSGFPISQIGPFVDTYDKKLIGVHHSVSNNKILGTVMDVDQFGNVTTNIQKSDVRQIGADIGTTLQITLGITHIAMPLKATYGNVSKQALVALYYDGFLQFAINEGCFSREHGVQRGAAVTVELTQ